MIYHSGIFYPSDKEELEKLAERTGKRDRAKAFILPHMDLRRCADLYRAVFSSIPDGTRVVAVLPLHRPPLLSDKDAFLFSSRARTEHFITGDVRIGHIELPYADAYEKEEYSLELLYPFMTSFCPSSELIPVFSYAQSGKDVRKLMEVIESLDEENTIFIVSSNMTDKRPDPVPERDRMIEILLSGESILDEYRKGHITACAAPVIEAVSRVIPGKWELVGTVGDDKAAGHAALLRH